jgi:hypothetical protein
MTESAERDRYQEATLDVAEHLGGKLWATLHATMRTPENQARIQSLLDPVVSHIIGRIFPYILLSAILFLILFLLSVGTFWMMLQTMRGEDPRKGKDREIQRPTRSEEGSLATNTA